MANQGCFSLANQLVTEIEYFVPEFSVVQSPRLNLSYRGIRDTCSVCGSLIQMNLFTQSVHLKLSIQPLWDGNRETKLGPKYKIQLSFLRSYFCKSCFYSLQ